jgi:O-antigen/teichoic acid export membrane protein
MFVFSAVASLVVLISMDFIYALVAPEAGPETLREVKAVLTILLFGLPIFYLTPVPMFGLILMNKQRYLVFIYLTGFLFNTISNLIFIPQYTYYAGATITILTEALLLVMLYYFGYRAWRSVTISK